MRAAPEAPAVGTTRPAAPAGEAGPTTATGASGSRCRPAHEPAPPPDATEPVAPPAPGPGTDVVPPSPAVPRLPGRRTDFRPARRAGSATSGCARSDRRRAPAAPAGQKIPPVAFEAASVETVDADDGTVATVLAGNVILRQQQAQRRLHGADRAARAVLFSRLKSLRDVQKSEGRSQRAERLHRRVPRRRRADLSHDPVPLANKPTIAEQRLEANRCYYDFATDRGHPHRRRHPHRQPAARRSRSSSGPRRSGNWREGEFTPEKVQISSSSFARPTFGIGADRIYVRQDAGRRRSRRPGRVRRQGGDAAGLRHRRSSTGRTSRAWPTTTRGSCATSASPTRPAWGPAAKSTWVCFRRWASTAAGPGRRLPGRLLQRPRPRHRAGRALPGRVRHRPDQAGRRTSRGSSNPFFVYDKGTDDIGRPLPATPRRRLPPPRLRPVRAPALLPRRLATPVPGQLGLRPGVPRAVLPPSVRHRPAARRVGLPQAPGGRRGADAAVPVPAQPPGHQQRLPCRTSSRSSTFPRSATAGSATASPDDRLTLLQREHRSTGCTSSTPGRRCAEEGFVNGISPGLPLPGPDRHHRQDRLPRRLPRGTGLPAGTSGSSRWCRT